MRDSAEDSGLIQNRPWYRLHQIHPQLRVGVAHRRELKHTAPQLLTFTRAVTLTSANAFIAVALFQKLLRNVPTSSVSTLRFGCDVAIASDMCAPLPHQHRRRFPIQLALREVLEEPRAGDGGGNDDYDDEVRGDGDDEREQPRHTARQQGIICLLRLYLLLVRSGTTLLVTTSTSCHFYIPHISQCLLRHLCSRLPRPSQKKLLDIILHTFFHPYCTM